MPQIIKDIFLKRNNACLHYDGYGHPQSKTLRDHGIDNFGRHFLLRYRFPLANHIDIVITNRAISVLTRGFGFCSLIQKPPPNYFIDIHCDQFVFLLTTYMYHWILNNSILNIQFTYIWQV